MMKSLASSLGHRLARYLNQPIRRYEPYFRVIKPTIEGDFTLSRCNGPISLTDPGSVR